VFYGAFPTANALNAVTRNPYPSQSSEILLTGSGSSGTHVWEIRRSADSSVVFTIDSQPRASLSTTIPTNEIELFFWAQSGQVLVDWVYVRPFVYQEPYSVSTGPEN